jgi:hypothetical protein
MPIAAFCPPFDEVNRLVEANAQHHIEKMQMLPRVPWELKLHTFGRPHVNLEANE